MRHFLNEADIDLTKKHYHELAGAYGKGERKTLFIVSTIKPLASRFVVENHGKVISIGTSLSLAIENYNNAKPERES